MEKEILFLFYAIITSLIGNTFTVLNTSTHSFPASAGFNTTFEQCNARPYIETWTSENFPNPQTDTDMDHCGRNCKQSWICDPEHVISPYEADKLDTTIANLKRLDICECPYCEPGSKFYIISVGIITQIAVYNGNSTEIFKKGAAFATHLRLNKWNYSSCDTDIVILLSRNDKMIWLSVGPVARNVISNECLDNIKNETSVMVKRGQFGAALNHMVNRLSRVFQFKICSTKGVGLNRTESLASEALIAGIGVFVILLGYGAYMVKSDLEEKAKANEDQLRSRRKRKRKLSLKDVKARRLSQMKEQQQSKEETESLNQVNPNVTIIVTDENGIDGQKKRDVDESIEMNTI